MAKIKLNGDTSGYIEISAPAVSGNNTLELGPGTRILTNLDNTFTGIATFSNGIHITSGGFILNQQRSDTHASLIIDKPDAGTGTLKFFNNGSASAYIQHTNSEHLNYYLPSGSGSQVFYTNGTEKLRILSSGQVVIGESTNYANSNADDLIVGNRSNNESGITIGSSNQGQIAFANSGADRAGLIHYQHTDNSMRFYINGPTNERLRIDSSGNLLLKTGEIDMQGGNKTVKTSAGFLQLGTSGSQHTAIITAGSERLRIGSDGHLSYKNSSPPAWSTDSGYANATLGSSAYLRTDTDVNSNFFTLGSNAYRGSSNWQHVNSGWATQLQQSAHTGDLYYSSSSTSGSADGTITWVEHFRVTSAGNFGIGDVPAAGDGGNSNYNNWDIPKLHVRGSSGSGKFHLLGRFRAGSDADNTGAQIVIHHENDRGMALQGGRSVSNRSYGAIKSLDNLAREATVMDFRGDAGQGVDYIKFYTGTTNSTTEQFKIDSSGRITKPNQPCAMAYNAQGQHMAGGSIAQFNSTRFNIGNMYNSSNGRMTVPVAGRYLVAYSGLHDYISQSAVGFDVRINGSAFNGGEGYQESNDISNSQLSKTLILDLSANDYVEIYIRQSGTQVHQRYGSFSMCLIT